MRKIHFTLFGLILILLKLDAQTINEFLPYYQVKLQSYEYPIYSQAVFSGINKYDGKLEYHVKVAKEENSLVCIIDINSKQIVQAIKYYISEISLKALENIDDSGNVSKLALDQISLIKSVSKKLDYALENPIRKPIRTIGKIVQNDSLVFVLTNEGETILLRGSKTKLLKDHQGKSIVLSGIVNEDKTIELLDFTDQKQNTLEVFIMSMCPFGQQAVSSSLSYLDKNSLTTKPKLEIHYIFYSTKDGFKTMHGEEELKEDLVQITIRDNYSKFFFPYLKQRFEKKNLSWQDIAASVGLKRNEIEEIEREIIESRNSIIDREFQYVAIKNQVFDGSPTFLWESQQIKNILKIRGFEDFNLSEGRCDSK